MGWRQGSFKPSRKLPVQDRRWECQCWKPLLTNWPSARVPPVKCSTGRWRGSELTLLRAAPQAESTAQTLGNPKNPTVYGARAAQGAQGCARTPHHCLEGEQGQQPPNGAFPIGDFGDRVGCIPVGAAATPCSGGWGHRGLLVPAGLHNVLHAILCFFFLFCRILWKEHSTELRAEA